MSSQVPYHSAIVLDELPLWTAEFDAYGILSRLIPRGNSIDVDGAESRDAYTGVSDSAAGFSNHVDCPAKVLWRIDSRYARLFGLL